MVKGKSCYETGRNVKKGDILIARLPGSENDLTVGKPYTAEQDELGTLPKGDIPGHVIVVNDKGKKKAYSTVYFTYINSLEE